jgi:hypothetical protein
VFLGAPPAAARLQRETGTSRDGVPVLLRAWAGEASKAVSVVPTRDVYLSANRI